MSEKIKYTVYFDGDEIDYAEIEAERARVDNAGHLYLESGLDHKPTVHAVFKNWKRVLEE